MARHGRSQPAQSDTAVQLQSLIWPEIGLCTERELYTRLAGPAAWSQSAREIRFLPGSRASFDTYYNLFNIGKWVKSCGLKTLELALEGEGRFELVVFCTKPDRSWERVINEIVTLPTTVSLTGPLSAVGGFDNRGVLFFNLRALGVPKATGVSGAPEGVLCQAHWQTSDHPRRRPDLMLSITTFKREAAVTRTAARFAAFIDCSPLRPHIRLAIVDNGQSATIPRHDCITLIPNKNLGGSGGFARGLLAARDSGASHCLFMDDDAAVHMEAIERSWMFLAYARDPKTAIAGAVSNAQHRWQLWENGALFDHICQPQHGGTDLRDIFEVLEMEFDSTASRPHNFYGGWWFFAFAVDAVRHMPFPFFVRGDDVSFSLVHDFDIVTLPGVISYQDEDFSVKETPLTVYLDLRSHLAHHLSLPTMEIGRAGLLKIILRFWLRALLAHHYETLEATHLALSDVLAGPEFFRDNADMSARRQEIGALTRQERWQPEEDAAPGRAAPRCWLPPERLAPRLLMKLTLNGYLLPGFRLVGNRIVLPAAKRGLRRALWGAADITYVTADGKRSYTVRHSKARAMAMSLPILRDMLRFWRGYPVLRNRWRDGYAQLTQPSFWRARLGLPNGPPADREP